MLIRATIVGRRFVAVGASAAAARAAGIRVTAYVVVTYVLASLMLRRGRHPDHRLHPDPGDRGRLDVPAADDRGRRARRDVARRRNGSVVATAVGAVFLTQLDQVVTANGAAQSVQFIIQGAIIALSVLLRNVPWRALRSRISAQPPRAVALAGAAAPRLSEREP